MLRTFCVFIDHSCIFFGEVSILIVCVYAHVQEHMHMCFRVCSRVCVCMSMCVYLYELAFFFL